MEIRTDVLSMSVLTTMAIMLVSIFIVPAVMFFISRRSHREIVPIYMNGINEGDNRFFINSFGGKEHLYLSNWYLRFEFGRRHLRIPSIIVAAAVLVVGFCLVIGGVIMVKVVFVAGLSDPGAFSGRTPGRRRPCYQRKNAVQKRPPASSAVL